MVTEKMENERDTVYVLTQEQISQIAAVGAQEGVKAFKEEQRKEERRRKKEEDKVRKTKSCLALTGELKSRYQTGSSSHQTSRQN